MSCFSPLRAYRKVGAYDSSTKRWPLTFKKSEGWIETAMDVPCGKCEGCKMDYARSWALRCMHESKIHDRSCVITLTYDDAHLPPDGELDKRVMQNWLKILRNRIGSFRYFGCGEYGSKGDRPHYHIILFGYDFPDKVLMTNRGSRQYDSAMLRSIWSKGLVSVGDLTFSSAAYIARYCFKKIGGDTTHKQPEYTLKSNRPGIGAGFAEKYGSDFVSASSCIIDGQRYKVPKFYESRLSEDDILALRSERLKHTLLESPTRVSQKRLFLVSKLKSKERIFEK